MKLRLLVATVAAVAVLAGCAVGNDKLKNMTTQTVEQVIVDGQTNVAAVKVQLGEPNFKQKEADGTDVWEYKWKRSRPSAKNFIPLNPVDEFINTEKSLRLWVNSDGIVTKHDLSGVFFVFRRPLIGADSTHSMRPLTQEELDDLVDPTEEAAKAQ